MIQQSIRVKHRHPDSQGVEVFVSRAPSLQEPKVTTHSAGDISRQRTGRKQLGKQGDHLSLAEYMGAKFLPNDLQTFVDGNHPVKQADKSIGRFIKPQVGGVEGVV